LTRGLHEGRSRWSGGLLLLAATASAGCSILIGVSGDPVVVGDEGGDAEVEAAVAREAGDEPDHPSPPDAATADAADALDPDAGDGAPE
jgi:hypothetical protein